MAASRTFGRRGEPQFKTRPLRNSAAIDVAGGKAEIAEALANEPPPPVRVELDPVDGELWEWKRARKQNFRIPWRQLSVTAGLCFGIASFVLPDSLDDAVQWLLYALAAASFYAGLRRHRHREP